MIPLFYPPRQDVDATCKEIRDTLESRWWGQGPKVDAWEKAFSEMFGFKYCVAVNSGTAALHIAYVLAGLERGKRAIVPVLTCSATSHAVKYTQADIDYCDIKPSTLTLDPADLDRLVTADTAAVVPVHIGGAVVDAAEITAWAKQHNVKVIEDAAQALGAEGVGYGDFTCFSFQAIKSLSCGDAGMLVCKTEEDYKRAKRLRWFSIDREQKIERGWQAWDRRGITFNQEEVGFKYQCTDIDACMGLAALPNFKAWEMNHRKLLAQKYTFLLNNCPGIKLMDIDVGASANWLFMIRVLEGKRDALAAFLAAKEIETNVAHVRNDLFNVFGGKREPLLGMDSVEFEYLCLPINSKVNVTDVDFICDAVWQFSK